MTAINLKKKFAQYQDSVKSNFSCCVIRWKNAYIPIGFSHRIERAKKLYVVCSVVCSSASNAL